MSLHIIIDGYNLIRQSRKLSTLDLQDIQLGRDALVDMLATYKKFKAHPITVVFDGTATRLSSPQRDQQKGIAIVFSRSGESADSLIKIMARKEGQKALVVSSDLEIVRSAASGGAATISARDFENKLTMALNVAELDIDRDTHNGWKPTTKKKGPSRRLSKKQRKNRAKIRKL